MKSKTFDFVMEFLPTNFSETDNESDCELVIDEPEVAEVIETPNEKKKPVEKKKPIKKKKPVKVEESEDDSDCEIKEEGIEEEKKEDCFMTLSETFNQHKLYYILNNQDEFKKQMRDSCFENDYNPFSLLIKYLANSKNGSINTNYKQNAGIGRFYAVKSLSMQSMPREIRHTIANEYYIDIDMVNAHPVILLHLCNQRQMFPKVLKRYVKNRDKLLDMLKVSRDDAKIVVLSLINGGNKAYDALEYKPKWLIDFKKEIEIIHKMFATDKAYEKHVEKREADGINQNHKASYMNILLCDFENKILINIYNHLKNPAIAVLCFDGLMILKDAIYNLKECQEYIYEQLGIKIELKVKPMDGGFEIKECPKYVEPSFDLYTDFEKLVNKEVYIERVSYWCKSSIVLINNGGNHFLMTKNKRIDSMTNEASIYYKQVSEKNLLNNLNVNCYVINEGYDAKFALEYNEMSKQEQDRVSPAQLASLKQYLYSLV